MLYLKYYREKKIKRRKFIHNSRHTQKKWKHKYKEQNQKSPLISNYWVKKFKIASGTAPAPVTEISTHKADVHYASKENRFSSKLFASMAVFIIYTD